MLPRVGVLRPRLVARLAGTRNRVEAPRRLAAVGVVGRDAAADPELASGEPRDHQPCVVKRCARDRLPVPPGSDFRGPDLLARARIECDQVAVELADVDASVADRNTATRPAAAHGRDLVEQVAVVPPDRLAALDVEREDIAGAGGQICDPVVNEWLRLTGVLRICRRIELDSPDALQVGDVRGSQLIERRITLVVDRAAVRDPLLFRQRGELIGSESGDALVSVEGPTPGQQQRGCADDQ